MHTGQILIIVYYYYCIIFHKRNPLVHKCVYLRELYTRVSLILGGRIEVTDDVSLLLSVRVGSRKICGRMSWKILVVSRNVRSVLVSARLF